MRPDPSTSPADRQRVRRELQKLVQVRHPTLVPIVDLGEEDDLTWIVRPFVVGETLAERIAARGRLSPVEAATLGLHLAAGLGELHRHGLLHRDLRPGHVLLGHDGGVYLIDAGLGRTFVAPDGRALVGCPGYAAPEAILGRLMSFRSDLYGLGAVLYEALSGMPPYMALDPRRMMQLQCEADPEPLDPSVPPALSRLVSTLLARDPRERPMSAQIVERQLEPMVPSIPPAAPDGDIELGERTLMTDAPDELISPAGLVFEAPAPAFRVEAPAPAVRPPTPAAPPVARPPALPSSAIKQTMMGLAPEALGLGTAPAARPSPVAEGLDFDDVVDTNQNEASRVFGIPATAQSAGGSAIPPLSAEPAQRPLEPAPSPFGGHAPTAPLDPKSGPRMAPPVFVEDLAAPGAFPLPAPAPAPQFEPPANHTVAMDAPPPAAFMNYGPPGPGPQAPPMYHPPGGPMMPNGPMPQGAPQWSPYGPGMQGVGPNVPPAPVAPTKSRGPALLLGLISLVAIAGGGGYLIARASRARHAADATPTAPSTSPLVAQPPMPVAQPALPTMPAAEVDAGATLAEADVPAPIGPDVGPAIVAVAPVVMPAVAATPDAGPPVVLVAPPLAAMDAGAPSLPRPTPVAHNPPAPPRPAVRPVPRPIADAGVVATPLTEAIRRQDWAAARRLLADQIHSHPSDAAAHAQLGYVLDRLGDNPGALTEYRSATRLDRRNTRYLHRLADLQVATGDRAGAVATLQQILRVNPAEPAARARLDQMQGAH
jgi:hypothetical protein